MAKNMKAANERRSSQNGCDAWRWLRLSTLLWFSAVHQVMCWRTVATNNNQWMHSLQLDNNYDLFWSVNEQEVTFELQVATLGYIMFGISNNDRIEDADLVVGWVQNGRARFQVTHVNCLAYSHK